MGRRGGQEIGHAETSGRLAKHGDVPGISPEALDVLVHPAQCGDLVVQPPVPNVA